MCDNSLLWSCAIANQYIHYDTIPASTSGATAICILLSYQDGTLQNMSLVLFRQPYSLEARDLGRRQDNHMSGSL